MKKVTVVFVGSGLVVASLLAASSGNVNRKDSAKQEVIHPNVELIIIGEESEDENTTTETKSSKFESPTSPSLFSTWSKSARQNIHQILGNEQPTKSKTSEVAENTEIYIPNDEDEVVTPGTDTVAAPDTVNAPVSNAAPQETNPEATMQETTVSETVQPVDLHSAEEPEEIVQVATSEASVEKNENIFVRFFRKLKSFFGIHQAEETRTKEAFVETEFHISNEDTSDNTIVNNENIVDDSANPDDSHIEVAEVVQVATSEASVEKNENIFVRFFRKLKSFFGIHQQAKAIDDEVNKEAFVATNFIFPDDDEKVEALFNKDPMPEQNDNTPVAEVAPILTTEEVALAPSQVPAESYVPLKNSSSETQKDSSSGFFGFHKEKIKSQVPENITKDPLAVVSHVEGTTHGPFTETGKYEIQSHNTGLLLPLGDGNRLCTTDYAVQLILKKPALLSVDRKTEFKIQKILDIQELILSKGRIRLKLLDQSGLWTIRGRDMSLTLSNNADVAVDMTGDLITRVFIFEGEADCMPMKENEAIHLKSGEHLSVGLGDSHQSEISSSTRDFLTNFLTFSEVENYAKKLMAAESFLQNGNLEWPLEGKVFSGVLCSQCGYAFDQNDQAFTFCPHCHEPLVLSKEIAPVNSMNSKPVTQTESSSAWIIVAAQAPKQFGH